MMPAAVADQSSPIAAQRSWTARGLIVVTLCFVINMLDGMDIMIMSYIAPMLANDWKVPPDRLGVIFSAGLAGMGIGCLFIAPLADRIGRRIVILGALALMSGGMIVTGLVPSLTLMALARFVIGLGIGTVLVAMAALVAEFSPERHRNLAVGIVQAGYPIAAVFTGLAAAQWLATHGWQTMLLAAGIMTLVMLPIAFLAMPESDVFLAGRSRVQSEDSAQAHGSALPMLFSAPLRNATLLLWTTIFSGFMVLYFIVSWIPKLSIDAGLSEANGIYAGVLYNFGAFCGTMLMSALSVRFRLGRLIPTFMIVAIAAMMAFGLLRLAVAPTMGLAFLIGITLGGGFNGVYPLAAALYPPESRATGIGWAVGVGRAGAVIGPMMGGLLMSWKVGLSGLFAIYSVPLLVCALAAFGAGRALDRRA